MNLDCPTLRLFVETISQGLISIPYPTFATLDLKDVAKGICHFKCWHKLRQITAAPKEKSREAEAKEAEKIGLFL